MKFLLFTLLAFVVFIATDAKKCWPVTDGPTKASTDPTDAPTNAPVGNCDRDEIKHYWINMMFAGSADGDLSRFIIYFVECLHSKGLTFDEGKMRKSANQSQVLKNYSVAIVVSKLKDLWNSLRDYMHICNTINGITPDQLTDAGNKFTTTWKSLANLLTGGRGAAFRSSTQGRDFNNLLISFEPLFANYATDPKVCFGKVTEDKQYFADLIDTFLAGIGAFMAAA